MICGFNFRLLYRVVFVSFYLVFVWSYRGGSSRYDRREEKTEPTKFKIGPAEHDPGGGDTKNPEFGKMAKKGKNSKM